MAVSQHMRTLAIFTHPISLMRGQVDRTARHVARSWSSPSGRGLPPNPPHVQDFHW